MCTEIPAFFRFYHSDTKVWIPCVNTDYVIFYGYLKLSTKYIFKYVHLVCSISIGFPALPSSILLRQNIIPLLKFLKQHCLLHHAADSFAHLFISLNTFNALKNKYIDM